MADLRLGLIGVGKMMRRHINDAHSDGGVATVAMADTSEAAIAERRSETPHLDAASVYSDYKEMLAKEKLDAVVISTPHTQHVDQVIDAFSAGCHVLCEKPLVTTVADAHKVISARDQAKKVGAIAYQRHGMGAFRLVREFATTGKYGKFIASQANNCQGWLTGTRGTWRQDPALSGGGQLNDTGSHVVDILQWATDSKPASVSAHIDNRGAAVDIDSAVAIRFTDGALSTIQIVGSGFGWYERFHFYFEEAIVTIHGSKMEIVEKAGPRWTCESWPNDISPVANFLAAIRGESEPQAAFESGLATIQLTEAAWKSAEQGGNAVEV